MSCDNCLWSMKGNRGEGNLGTETRSFYNHKKSGRRTVHRLTEKDPRQLTKGRKKRTTANERRRSPRTLLRETPERWRGLKMEPAKHAGEPGHSQQDVPPPWAGHTPESGEKKAGSSLGPKTSEDIHTVQCSIRGDAACSHAGPDNAPVRGCTPTCEGGLSSLSRCQKKGRPGGRSYNEEACKSGQSQKRGG